MAYIFDTLLIVTLTHRGFQNTASVISYFNYLKLLYFLCHFETISVLTNNVTLTLNLKILKKFFNENSIYSLREIHTK